MLNVAFFGGSFDPPHFGHVLAACYARGRGFDRVLVVPVHQHALGKHLQSFERRWAMVELAFQSVQGVEVSDVECRRDVGKPNYTLHTLQTLMREHPDWRLRLLIGSDILAEIHKWYRFDEIERIAPPFILPRAAGESAEPGLLPDVSSTRVREALARRQVDPAARDWLERVVPNNVVDYIEEHGLYLPLLDTR